MKYIWDTNTIIYLLQKQFTPKAERVVIEIAKETKPLISFITEIELLCWKSADDASLNVVKNFIDDALIIELDQHIKSKTIQIRRSYKTKLPDAIIAATSIVNNCTLITRNLSDFNAIRGLKILDPWNM